MTREPCSPSQYEASGIPGNMLKVIASAATRARKLTLSLVEGFRFQTEDWKPKGDDYLP